MPGSDTSTRTQPPRRFENYILTKVVDSSVGLSEIPDSFFTPVVGPGAATSADALVGAGAPGTDDATSNPTPIGFDFEFDGVTYKSWCANTNGWMTLVDPTLGTFTTTEVLVSGSTYLNVLIKDTFTSQAVLLCPWFDDLRNVSRTAADLANTPFLYSATKISRIGAGLEPAPIFLNNTGYGLRYYNDTKSPQGRRLIVRWTSATNYALPTSVVRFESILYENGTIEFRYSPRETIYQASIPYEGATVGIFMPNGTNRFRDFSPGLGYRESSRQEYAYGGFTYDASYSDAPAPGSEDYIFGYTAAVPYTVNLLPFRNWPGLTAAGCVMRFQPPLSRRRVLPRVLSRKNDSITRYPLATRTGDHRTGRVPSTFDDRRSPTYTPAGSSVVVNYPTTLQRFIGGNGPGVSERQDLFSGDFLVTGSIVKSAIDQFVDENLVTTTPAFDESARPEQSSGSLGDVFFVSGSTADHLGIGFDQGLRAKTQIRITLPVANLTTLPATTSSIYYYNRSSRSWEVPFNSTYIISNTGTTPPSPNPYAGGDWANAQNHAIAGRITEDARGFGPIGNIVSSGSHTAGSSEQTDAAIGSAYDYRATAEVIGKSYAKSLRNNEEYRATQDETFSLPISAPFLIEKVVFDVPFAFGPGWFSDKTQCFIPLSSSGGFDFAGPALTLALHRQVQLASHNLSPTFRDLILTGTITHQLDNTASIALTSFPPYDTTYQLRLVGFSAYAGPPGAIVQPTSLNCFTGSVQVKAESLTATGIAVKFTKTFNGLSATNRTNVTNFLTKTPSIVLVDSATQPAQTVKVGSVAPLGRAGTGFQAAGRAAMGGEFVTTQGLSDPTGRLVANPFNETSLTTSQLALLTASMTSSFVATASTIIPLVTSFPEPYMVMPGDKLTLSVSKMRPFIFGGGVGIPRFSGSVGHDVVLMPGNINITFYGSQIKEGVEFHDTLNQPLGSDVVHEVLSSGPVIDQFEPSYRNEYSGSYTDNVMLGSLTTTTTRDRKLSWLNARNAAALSTNVTDVLINAVKSYRSQPWWERAGNVRTVQHTDSSERYWDSMMPSISDCFAADGSGIFIAPPGTFGDFRQIDVEITGSTSTFNPKKVHPGWIFLDQMNPSLLGAGYGPITNGNWNKSFPFEPRYQHVSRQLDVSKTLLATYMYQPYGSPIVGPISPVPVNGLIFGTAALGTLVVNILGFVSYTRNTPIYEWFVDSNLASKTNNSLITATMPAMMYPTSSMTIDDASRALFGFGDRNTHYQITNGDGTKSLLGTNHLPDHRDVEGPHPDGFYAFGDSSNFAYSPTIRGWKYGVQSGIASYSKAYWRHDRFGQFRDMLEQRPYTKYYQTPTNVSSIPNFQQGVQPAAVTVTFVDQDSGRLTAAENTWSNNLSFECTSSLPFFDGISLNRPTIIPKNLNLHPNTIGRDAFGNIHIV